jgi:hypothetical protein
MRSHRRLIEKFLETRKHLPYFFGPSEICNSVGNRVVVPEAEQWSQFFLIEFIGRFNFLTIRVLRVLSADILCPFES